MPCRSFVVLLCLGLAGGPAGADTLLLLQGYLGQSTDWRSTGIAAQLVQAGWQDGGTLRVAAAGVRSDRPPARAPNRFFTLRLPTEAPLRHQARSLDRYVRWLRATRDGPLILVGHSAGGVLARLYMVQNPAAPVAALITIASPNLGSGSAELGALLGDTPLSLLAPLLGAGTLNRSQGLYRDLAPEAPGTFLYWLNRQPHPAARYIAIVRTGGAGAPLGDLIVPQWSQGLEQVHALRGRAHRLAVPGSHALGPDDGPLLVRLLRWLRRA